MKSSEVRKILRISNPSLVKYRRQGLLKATELPNGFFDYDDESVYSFLNKGLKRKTYLYARVSTSKQRKDLENQIDLLKQYCFSNGIQIHGIYRDIASGISFDKRKEFFQLLHEIIDKKVEKVIITYKDRISRVGFDLFSYLFQQFGTNIIVISEIGNPKLDSEEIFEEIISMLHCYSMKLYSKRKNPIIRQLITEAKNGDSE
ncbi:MAG TPA: IS607 family transposase [Candidatus Lokiarchaeia archaeon]|nr:IS607 family transposase [Candidatus Lokiarchaeia archaeon]